MLAQIFVGLLALFFAFACGVFAHDREPRLPTTLAAIAVALIIIGAIA